MSNSKQKPGLGNETLSPFDQTEKILSDIVEDHKLADFLTQMKRYQKKYAAAKPRIELTDKDIETLEEAKAADSQQQKRDWLRNLLKAIVRQSGSNSQLREKALEGLELLDQIEAGNNSLWRKLDTIVFAVIEMCRAESKKPTETGQKVEGNTEAMRDQVFICYSHKDERWLEDLETHLKPYVRNGSITAWSDKQIAPGSKWLKEIEAALASTKVAVLLVTPNFLASDFIHENELGPLLKKAEKGKVTIIWIPVRACSYKETPLKDYQAAVEPEKPLANMKAERDKSWVKICEEIKKATCA